MPSSAEFADRDTIQWKSINTVRTLAMDAVEKAKSGHPGTPMALAPAAYVMWREFHRFNPKNPDWANRDRFVLSCGHASMLLYAMLFLTGYDLSLDEIKNFRQWHSKTPGHPERGHTVGVETTTGPLGQGFGNAVGMAIAERLLSHHFNRPGFEIINHRVWGFCSDGDLMEGVSSEAASLAGHLRLGKLNFIYDNNHITIDGSTSLAFSEDVGKRFEAYGWHVQHVDDGNDLDAIHMALEAARREETRPSLIVLRTHIGDPAPTKRDTAEAHGAPLGAEEVKRTKEILDWPQEKFFVPDDALAHWREAVPRGEKFEAEWNALFERYAAEHPEDAAELKRVLSGTLPDGWDSALPAFTPKDGPLATRQASQKVLRALANAIPELAGGSADLVESTGLNVDNLGTFGPVETGRLFHFGIREHGMAASLNGMAAHGGVRPFGSTFLIFSDYMKPSVRLAALMGVPVIFIGTHDSIGLGEDGPTHQPVEQLAMLRAIPNLNVIRPADASETREAWHSALTRTDGPTIMALTRQKLPILDRTTLAPSEGARRGAYVLKDSDGKPDAIVIGTGSEVHLALAAAETLNKEGIRTRVVSMPSWELFAQQEQGYRDTVLPPDVRKRVSIEAAATQGWGRWITDDGIAIGIDHFGASAPGEKVMQEFGFTAQHVVDAVHRLAGRSSS
ncbi:MAG TPA: transketolase [Gemmatimonadales bacterium]|nr:transketolase [Gemmatimonadales bacterium]